MGKAPDARAPVYEENGTLTIHLELAAAFDESYEGDDDGYVWLQRFRSTVQPKIIRAVFDALRNEASIDAIPVSRGRAPDENVDIEVRVRARGPSLPLKASQ